MKVYRSHGFIPCIAGWDDIQFSQALAQAGDDAVIFMEVQAARVWWRI